FSSFDGADLHNTTSSSPLRFIMQHSDCCPNQSATGVPGGSPATDPKDPFFEGDLILAALSLDLKTNVVAPFATFGLTNKWDVGVVVPLVRVQLNPRFNSTLDRISTASNPVIHSFDGNGSSTKVVNLSGSATGLGDIAIRTKYRFVDFAHG